VTRERWLAERRDDPWIKRAKREGYPSRAAYKLKHIQSRYRVLHTGDIVVELGAAPGGMLKAAAEMVGEDGLVLGVDVRPISLGARNVKTLTCDIYDPHASVQILKALGDSKCDVLISDASPHLTGAIEVDRLRQIDLLIRCVEIADDVLEDGGHMILKAFDCPELKSVERPLSLSFASYRRVVTPPTARKHSSEVYLVCLTRTRAPIAPLMRAELQSI
jgi:23S rRNA (uridine2552-2'-O)-methyltransferase